MTFLRRSRTALTAGPPTTSPRTGDVSDLALLPDHLGVGMGVVDVRTEAVQSVEAIETLGAAGAQIVSPNRIALNPDCGFAPGAGQVSG